MLLLLWVIGFVIMDVVRRVYTDKIVNNALLYGYCVLVWHKLTRHEEAYQSSQDQLR